MRRVVEWTHGYHWGVPRGVCHGERSGVHCRDLPENGRIVRYPSQEVEQDRGHYYGLPGSDGATWNPSQEVEQSHGYCCGLPGSDGAAWNPSRKWSRVVAFTAAYQGVMEPHEICCRKWSRVMAVTAACQGVQVCRSKFGWSPVFVEAQMGIICRRISIEACLQ